jgi:hypothetical protein
MLKDFPSIPIHVCFPIIITDASRGVIQARINEAYEVIDLEDKGLCIYTYTSENADSFEIVLDNSFVLPIIICNLSNLPSAIGLISQIVNCIIEQTRQLVATNPWLIPEEILFNDKVIGL